MTWIDSFRETNTTEKELVAIDGKTLRRSHDHKNDLGALHIVSAFSCENGISLGQIACEEKSNEITAIPELLDSIELEDAVITIDAMGTQKKIADAVLRKYSIAKNAGYVLAVKDNHKKLHKAIRELFETTDLSCRKVSRCVEEEISHGREEHREYYQMTVPDKFSQQEDWAGLKTVGMAVRTHMDKNGKSKTETRYSISEIRYFIRET